MLFQSMVSTKTCGSHINEDACLLPFISVGIIFRGELQNILKTPGTVKLLNSY